MSSSEETVSVTGQAGFSILEVVISLAILMTLLVATSSLLVTSFKVGANSRFRQAATEIATSNLDYQVQEGATTLVGEVGDTALSSVTTNGQTYLAEMEISPYTSSNASSCANPNGGLAMLKITVWVTWANETGTDWWVSGSSTQTGLLVSETTLLALPSTAFNGNDGSVLVDITGVTGSSDGIRKVTTTLTNGTNTYTANTTSSGCALFANLAPGTWTVTASRTGYIDDLDDWTSSTNSATALSGSASVVAGNVSTVDFTYDKEATVTPSYSVTLSGSSPWLPTGLSGLPLTFYTSYGTAFPATGVVMASPASVFPSNTNPSYYAVAGSCGIESSPAGASLSGATSDGTSVTVTPGGTATPVIPLTPVNLVVTDSGTAVSNASITAAVSASDANCGTGTLAMPTLGLGTTCVAGSACAGEVAYRHRHRGHSDAILAFCGSTCTNTSVTSSSSSAIYGAPVTFTATVSCQSSCSGEPSGTVTFYDGGTSLGTGTLNGANPDQATYTTAAGQLGINSNSITASYGGSGFTWQGSTSGSLTQTVTTAATTTVLSSNPDPNGYGSSAVLTATVTAASPSAASPTGKVNFTSSSGTSISGCSAVAVSATTSGVSTATCTWSALSGLSPGTSFPSVGATFTASTSPTDFTGSTATNISQSVTTASSSTALSSSAPSGAVVGASVTFTATITISTGATPAGTVAFTSNGTAISGCTSATVSSVTSTATCTTSALTAGADAIKAVFTPSNTTDFAGSNITLTQAMVASSGTPSIVSGLPYGVWILTVTYGSHTATYTLTVTPGYVQLGSQAPQTAGSLIVLAD